MCCTWCLQIVDVDPDSFLLCPVCSQLRLHKVRKYLKEQAADRSPVQTYQCPRCRTAFSSLDAIRLLDPASQLFLCDNCGCVQGLAEGSASGTSAA